MLVFPNGKINLGLHITEKRSDGFHNIETVFYPVNWCDALEVIENTSSNELLELSFTGTSIDVSTQDNILYKTWLLIQKIKKLPPIRVHLHKAIPMGAGLGGGSSNAAFFIKLLDQKFELNLANEEKLQIARQLGSDCAFFLQNKPSFASGKGDELDEVACNLSDYYILIVNPGIISDTKEAYRNVIAAKPKKDLRAIITQSVATWKSTLVNDFEKTIFKHYPAIEDLKNRLYENGAIYASMSGSGSSVYGIFSSEPKITLPPAYKYCLQKPASSVL